MPLFSASLTPASMMQQPKTTRSGAVYSPVASPAASPSGRPHLARTATMSATLCDAAGLIGSGMRTRHSAPFEEHGGHMLRARGGHSA